MAPELSIVVPSHRRTDLLALCLKSVFRFAPIKTEVIVVDDGSNDAIVSRTAAAFEVRVIRHSKSRGFCAAANAGIAAARAPIVELLNDDAEVTENWTAALKWFDQEHVAAVTPLVLKNQPGPVRIDSAGDNYDRGGYANKQLHNAEFSRAATVRKRCVSAVSACAAFYRRSALLDAGGFPEPFGAYFDDVDLSLRLRARGHQLLFDPTSVVWHRVGASHRPSRRLLEQQSRNEEWLYWRNREKNTLLRHAAVLAGKACRRLEEGTLAPWISGRLRALTAFPR